MSKVVRMSSARFEEIVDTQIEKCRQMILKKAEEYAADEDRLHNFRVAAALEGTSLRQALAGMMVKHVVSIYDMCFSYEDYTMAMWEEKIGDNLNYLFILKAVITEDLELLEAQLKFPLAS